MKTLTQALHEICSNSQWFKLSKTAKSEFQKMVEAEKISRESGFQFGGILEVENLK
jgi:hypothetical protein